MPDSMTRVWLFSTGHLLAIEALLERSGSVRRCNMPITCAIVQTVDRLVLVDVGFGERTARSPLDYPGLRFCSLMPVQLPHEETATGRLRELGFAPDDVTDVVLTHLHLDHAGALEDFPTARVHVSAEEFARANASVWPLPNMGYDGRAWEHGPRWSVFSLDGGEAFGLDRSRDLFGDGVVTALDTPGHSRGHVAFAIAVGERVLVHAGDAYFRDSELDVPDIPRTALGPGMRVFRWAVVDDADREQETIRRLAALRARPEVTLINSHDQVYLERLPRFPEPVLEASAPLPAPAAEGGA